LPSVKIGSKIFGLDWRVVWQDVLKYFKMSDVKDIFKTMSADFILPAFVGFLVLALLIAVCGYFVSLYIVIRYKNRR